MATAEEPEARAGEREGLPSLSEVDMFITDMSNFLAQLPTPAHGGVALGTPNAPPTLVAERLSASPSRPPTSLADVDAFIAETEAMLTSLLAPSPGSIPARAGDAAPSGTLVDAHQTLQPGNTLGEDLPGGTTTMETVYGVRTKKKKRKKKKKKTEAATDSSNNAIRMAHDGAGGTQDVMGAARTGGEAAASADNAPTTTTTTGKMPPAGADHGSRGDVKGEYLAESRTTTMRCPDPPVGEVVGAVSAQDSPAGAPPRPDSSDAPPAWPSTPQPLRPRKLMTRLIDEAINVGANAIYGFDVRGSAGLKDFISTLTDEEIYDAARTAKPGTKRFPLYATHQLGAKSRRPKRAQQDPKEQLMSYIDYIDAITHDESRCKTDTEEELLRSFVAYLTTLAGSVGEAGGVAGRNGTGGEAAASADNAPTTTTTTGKMPPAGADHGSRGDVKGEYLAESRTTTMRCPDPPVGEVVGAVSAQDSPAGAPPRPDSSDAPPAWPSTPQPLGPRAPEPPCKVKATNARRRGRTGRRRKCHGPGCAGFESSRARAERVGYIEEIGGFLPDDALSPREMAELHPVTRRMLFGEYFPGEYYPEEY